MYRAINIKTWSIFAVKKLNLVSLNLGIDKDAINKLKVIPLIIYLFRKRFQFTENLTMITL